MEFRMLLKNQKQIIELGLDMKDVLIFDWIMGMCERKIHLVEGQYYFEVNENDITKDLPIIGIKSQAHITRRLQKLCNANFLESANSGTKKVYKTSTNANLMI